MRKILLLLITILPFVVALGQNSDPQKKVGVWNAWSNSIAFSAKWKLDTDIHFRFWEFEKDPSNLVLRGAFTYLAKPWAELQAGFGYFESYPYGEEVDLHPNSTEHRFHGHLQWKHKIKKYSLNYRFRSEDRHIHAPTKKEIWRGRFRFVISHPVAEQLYGFTSYEHLWTWSDLKFEQGRLIFGLGHPLGKHVKVEAAYLHQFFKNNIEYNRLQINLFTNFQLTKEKQVAN